MRWKSLDGKVDADLYHAILARLEYQAGAAELWRDAVCEWFYITSGIPDAQNRVGHHDHRVEAENMTLVGYKLLDIRPWEDASRARAVTCAGPAACTASTQFTGSAGTYTIDVRYFDARDGVATFTLSVNGKQVDAWQASDNLPTNEINGTSSTRRRIAGVSLAAGDTIMVSGWPDDLDPAALDYIETIPEK